MLEKLIKIGLHLKFYYVPLDVNNFYCKFDYWPIGIWEALEYPEPIGIGRTHSNAYASMVDLLQKVPTKIMQQVVETIEKSNQPIC